MGMAMMGSGLASGENRAKKAAEAAVHSPLMEDVDLNGAKGVLVNVTAGSNLKLQEFHEVGNTVQEFASEHANVVLGTVIDDTIDDEIRVTVVATGLETDRLGESNIENRSKEAKDTESPSGSKKSHSTTPTVIQGSVELEPEQGVLDIPAFLRRQAD